MHHSSPASHSEFFRLKLLVSYRPSCVSGIEYYHSLDAVLFLAGRFDHSPAYWVPSIITRRRRFRRIARVCRSSNISTSRSPFRIKAHVYRESNFCNPDEAVSHRIAHASEQKCYHIHEAASCCISRVSELE